MNTQCPICDGESYALGEMGTVEWFRCRACGMDWYTTLTSTYTPTSVGDKPDG